MRVKICGVRRIEDALACVEAGADAIGFNFWPQSKRYLPIEEACAIAPRLPPSITRVGVFVNAAPAEVERAFSVGAITLAQFHGDEDPTYCARFSGRYLKAIRLRDAQSLALFTHYDCPLFLVDSDSTGYGGSGEPADAELAREAGRKRAILLAGGLTPENVGAAIATVLPHGVDVAGGVEHAPGIKDRDKIFAFVRAAKRELGHERG